MISEIVKAENKYQAAFRARQVSGAGAAPSWLERLRERSMDQFAASGFPGVADEEWKYTNVSAISKADFAPAVIAAADLTADQLSSFTYTEARETRLVFVNGLLRRDFSSLQNLPAGFVVLGLDEALSNEQFSEVVREYLGRVVEPEGDGFTALNTAFVAHGAFVFIPKNAVVESPLHLLFLTQGTGADDGSKVASFPRVLVIAEENSSATVIESYAGLNEEAHFTNAVVELVLNEGARLVHYRVQNENENTYHVTTTGAHLGRQSSFDSTNITLGARLSRHNIAVVMDHEGAECWLDGLYLVGDQQHTDTHSVIDHKQPHCTSHQLYKGILDGKSRAVFNGKVFVRHGALGTDANQTNKNLLLSNDAQVDTKPQLEIDADDVKCAHGAAIGQLAEDELFYLASRGIHSDLARNLLTYGFAEEVIAKIKIDSIKAQLDAAVLNRLNARLEA